MTSRRPHPMLAALTVITVFLGVIWLAQRSLIYFPHGSPPSPAALGLPEAEIVTFDTEDGLHLEAWFVPAREPAQDRTVVVFNGNAGHRGHRAVLGALFAEHGLSTLLVDYRGYGGNPGLPSEAGLGRDARAAIAYLASRPDVNLARVVYFGESLGAAVAVGLAAQYPPAALILRSPFSTLAEIGQRHYPFLPVRWFLRDRFPSIERIGAIESPVLVIAGNADRIVPLDDSEALYEAARQPKRMVVIEGADHNDAELIFGPRVIRAVLDFLGEGAPQPQSGER